MDHNIINYGHERCKRTDHQVHLSMRHVLIVGILFSAGGAEIGKQNKTKLRTQCLNKQGFKKSCFLET